MHHMRGGRKRDTRLHSKRGVEGRVPLLKHGDGEVADLQEVARFPADGEAGIS